MQRIPRLTVQQFRLLVALWTIGSTIIAIQASMVSIAKQDAWIAVALFSGINMLFIWIYVKLGKKYPSCSFIELNKKLLGQWLGGLLALHWILTAFAAVAALLSYVGYFMATSFMVDTPIQMFHILFTCLMVLGLYYGIETIGRATQLLFIVFIVTYSALVLFVLPKAEFTNMLPVFETGLKSLLNAGFVYLSYSGYTVVFLLMVFPTFMADKERAARAFFEGSALGNALTMIITIVTIMVLGVDATSRAAYPSYELARIINIGNFITRIEVIMTLMWLVALFVKLTLYFHAAVAGTAQLLAFKDQRVLILPLAVISIVLSIIIYPNTAYTGHFDIEIWPVYMAVSGVLHPLLLLIVSPLREMQSRTAPSS